MTATHAATVIGGFLVVLIAMTAVMIRINRSERRYIDRRRQEWIARGGIPEDEPKFYSGSSDAGGSSG